MDPDTPQARRGSSQMTSESAIPLGDSPAPCGILVLFV